MFLLLYILIVWAYYFADVKLVHEGRGREQKCFQGTERDQWYEMD